MMMKRILVLAAGLLLMGVAIAQFGWNRDSLQKAASGAPLNHADFGIPDWEVSPHMPGDVFTFARLQYSGYQYGGGSWAVDYPDSDLNFSWRLQQLTSLEVNPQPVIVKASDPKIFDYPFIYMIEPGGLEFTDDEVKIMRQYLTNGGFMMVDDFWGQLEFDQFASQMERLLPGKEPQDLTIDHPIFHQVFDLDVLPQIPAIDAALRGRAAGITYQVGKPPPHDVRYKAYYDDDGRMVCFVGWNTDIGDGWEREGENHWYFKEFSEKYAFPLGINIVFYALTH